MSVQTNSQSVVELCPVDGQPDELFRFDGESMREVLEYADFLKDKIESPDIRHISGVDHTAV